MHVWEREETNYSLNLLSYISVMEKIHCILSVWAAGKKRIEFERLWTNLDQVLVSVLVAGQSSLPDELGVKQFCDQQVGLLMHVPIC